MSYGTCRNGGSALPKNRGFPHTGVRASHAKTILLAVSVTFLFGRQVVLAQSLTNVGKPMPTLKVTEWISPETVTAEGLQNRPYVIEFWATWCGPCRQSVPHLVSLTRKLKPRGLIMIGMSRDQPKDVAKVRKFYKDYKMNYPVAMDGGVGSQLAMPGIPHAFVVDQTGMIAWEGHPMAPEFKEAIERVLEDWVIHLDEYGALRPLALRILREGGKEEIASLLKKTKDTKDGAEATKLLAGVRKLAGLELARAEKSAERMPSEAVRELDAVARKYEGIEEARQAAAKARKIRSAPGFADEAAVASALNRIQDSHVATLRKRLAGMTDQARALRAALVIFEDTERKYESLVSRYPQAKTSEVARQQLKHVRHVIQSIKAQIG